MKKLKYILFAVILVCAPLYLTFLLKDKVVIVTKRIDLKPSTAKTYLLNLYARYQLRPDLAELQYGLHLLLASDDLSKDKHEIIQNIINDLGIIKAPYPEKQLLQKISELEPIKSNHELSFMGVKLSKFITENNDLLQARTINSIRWAALAHDNFLFQEELGQLQSLKISVDPKILAELKLIDVSLPKLPWLKWLNQLSDKG